ncbi:MAG TPA: NmrA/HSCARG family protein [Candidatus Krumholzibacteria bacterium]
MAAKKIITVIGSTGAQGGGVVRAILADKSAEFGVRAVTRKADSDKARALKGAGAEVVEADLDDAASLRHAFEGAHGAFCVTNYWEHFSADKEIAQARNMAQAAKQAGLKHVVWSTLEDVRKWYPLSDTRMPTIDEKWKVPHFDGKGEADHFFTESGVPTTFLMASFYWENFIYFGAGPKPGPDGTLALTFPMRDTKMDGIAAEDIGRCAYGMFKRGASLSGKHVGISGGKLTIAEYADAMSKALGRKVVYNQVTADQYRAFGFPGAVELGNMFQFYDECVKDVGRVRDVAVSRELNPQLQSFDQWLAANASRIPLE